MLNVSKILSDMNQQVNFIQYKLFVVLLLFFEFIKNNFSSSENSKTNKKVNWSL